MENATRPKLANLGPNLRNAESTEAAHALLKGVIDSYPPTEIVTELARTEWDSPTQVIDIIDQSGLLPKPTRTVESATIYFYTLGTGGGERVTKDIANIWKGMGLDSYILLDKLPDNPDEIPAAIPCSEIPNFFGINADNYALRATSLAAKMEAANTDAFVFAHWYVRTLPFDLLLLRLLGIRTYIYIQNSFTLFFLDNDLPSDYVDIPLSYILANAVICLSEMDKVFWSNFTRDVIRANNPITLEPRSSGCALKGHNIIWPARLHHDKSPERAIPIMNELVKSVPDAKLYMVGPCAPEMEPIMRNLIAQYGLQSNIVLCGAQPEDKMRTWYEKCDAFLLGTLKEGYPLVLAEAQACGLPCVMYNLPYLTLANSEGVISVPQGNYKMAAKQLEILLTDKEKAQEIGEKGRLFITKLAKERQDEFWLKLFSGNQSFDPVRSEDFAIKRMLARELMTAHRWHYRDAEETRQVEIDRISNLEQEKTQLENAIAQLKDELSGFDDSPSYKIGRAITYIPRRIRDFAQGIRK